MKKKIIVLLSAISLVAVFSLSGCGGLMNAAQDAIKNSDVKTEVSDSIQDLEENSPINKEDIKDIFENIDVKQEVNDAFDEIQQNPDIQDITSDIHIDVNGESVDNIGGNVSDILDSITDKLEELPKINQSDFPDGGKIVWNADEGKAEIINDYLKEYVPNGDFSISISANEDTVDISSDDEKDEMKIIDTDANGKRHYNIFKEYAANKMMQDHPMESEEDDADIKKDNKSENSEISIWVESNDDTDNVNKKDTSSEESLAKDYWKELKSITMKLKNNDKEAQNLMDILNMFPDDMTIKDAKAIINIY